MLASKVTMLVLEKHAISLYNRLYPIDPDADPFYYGRRQGLFSETVLPRTITYFSAATLAGMFTATYFGAPMGIGTAMLFSLGGIACIFVNTNTIFPGIGQIAFLILGTMEDNRNAF